MKHVLLFLLLSLVAFACASPPLKCDETYNCPAQHLCKEGQCVASSQPVSIWDGGLQPERLLWVNDDGTVPAPESATASTCKTSEDCNQESQPHCWKETCVSGYLELDFGKGHFVIERDSPLQACTEGSECKAWQQCFLGFCRDNVGTQSEASGKLLDAGLFLGEYSYSSLAQRDGAAVVQIVMVGTFSEKLQKHLVLEIPQDRFTLGNHTIDGTMISATLYDVQLDLVPRRMQPRAYAIIGSLRILHAGLQLGEKVAGSASLQLRPLSP